jgi:hypothetical protein
MSHNAVFIFCLREMTAIGHEDAKQWYPHHDVDIECGIAARPGVRGSPRRDEIGQPQAEPAEDDSGAVRDEPDISGRCAAAHPEFHRACPFGDPLAGTNLPGDKADGTKGPDPFLMR